MHHSSSDINENVYFQFYIRQHHHSRSQVSNYWVQLCSTMMSCHLTSRQCENLHVSWYIMNRFDEAANTADPRVQYICICILSPSMEDGATSNHPPLTIALWCTLSASPKHTRQISDKFLQNCSCASKSWWAQPTRIPFPEDETRKPAPFGN